MFRKLQIILLVTALALGAGLNACLDEVPEDLTAPYPLIPIPTGLSAVMTQDSVTLYWLADTDFDFSGFAVYRSENEGFSWTKAGEVFTSPFGDGALRPGTVYLYRGAGLDAAEVEGSRSDPLVVRSSIFAIAINNGDEFTNQRQAEIFFSAPASTQYVRFSENPDLTGAAWYNFQLSSNFTLSEGDGQKVVYAGFIDEFGNLTDKVSDTIVLDTQASIDSLIFSPASPVPPGASMHFRVVVTGAETSGNAYITIPGLGADITARDDGTGGDGQAGDGIYEKDFTLPSNFRGTDILIMAVFIDAAGNQSEEFESPLRLDMTDLPTAVVLYPAVDSTTTSISLGWSEAAEEGFFAYKVYRDDSPGISEETSNRLTTIFDLERNYYADTEVFEGRSYYYAVFLSNDLGESVMSNERLVQTENIPPAAVVLDTLTAVGTDRVTLTWSQNGNTDFSSYRIYQAISPGVDSTKTLVATLSDKYTTYLDVSGLNLATNIYYFRVYVYDEAGLFSRSNEVSSE